MANQCDVPLRIALREFLQLGGEEPCRGRDAMVVRVRECAAGEALVEDGFNQLRVLTRAGVEAMNENHNRSVGGRTLPVVFEAKTIVGEVGFSHQALSQPTTRAEALAWIRGGRCFESPRFFARENVGCSFRRGRGLQVSD